MAHGYRNGVHFVVSGPNANQRLIVIDARRIPDVNALQNPRPSRCENASGTKNGSPSGTRISVSRASRAVVSRSRSFVHSAMNATMLTTGNVRSKAPSLGCRSDSSETPATINPAITARHHRYFLRYWPPESRSKTFIMSMSGAGSQGEDRPRVHHYSSDGSICTNTS